MTVAKETFGSYIRRLRGEQTKKEVAKTAGFTAEYIRLIEDENRIPSQEILLKLAKSLGVDETDLIFRALQEKAPNNDIKKLFQPITPRYPALREILCLFYDCGIVHVPPVNNCLSKEEIKRELQTDEFHILEEALLKIVLETLKGKNLFNPKIEKLDLSKFGDAESYFSKLNPSEAKEKTEQALHGWTYNKKNRELHFLAKSSNKKESVTPLIYKFDFVKKS